MPAGGTAFHDGWTFHGSPPSRERADRERRSIISHMLTTRDDVAPDNVDPSAPASGSPFEAELDEVFFPVMWREDGYRTPLDRGALDGAAAGAGA